MLKESTRKGWAGVLATALAAAGLTFGAAAPAQAAPTSMNLAPVSGTSTNGVLGTYFVMKASAVNATQSEDIKFFVEGILSSDISNDLVFFASTEDLDADEVVAFSEDTTIDTTVSIGSVDVVEIDADAKTLSFGPENDEWDAGNFYYIGMQVDASSAKTVKITPFVENETVNGKPDSGETTYDPLTITYGEASDVAVSTTLELGAIGANTDDAVVKFDDVNMTSIVGPSIEGVGTVKFQKNGSDTASEEITFDVGAYSSSKGGFVVENTDTTYTLDVSDVLTAKAKILSADYGTANLSQVGDSPVGSIDANLSFFPGADVNRFGTSTTTGDVRAESGTVVITANVNADDGETAAGHDVTFTIGEGATADAATGATITAGGETLSPTDSSEIEAMTVTVQADADGDAVLSIDYSDLENGELFTVKASTATSTNDFTQETNLVILTAADPTPTEIIEQDRVSGFNEVVAGTSKSYTFWILDQFGQAFTAKDTRVQWEYNGNTGTSVGNGTGIHTVSITDNNNAAATTNVNVNTYDIYTSGAWSADASATGVQRDVSVVTATKGVNRIVMSGVATAEKNNSGIDIYSGDVALAAFDSKFVVDASTTTTDAQSFDVTVYNEDGAPYVGAEVTISSDDEVFFFDGVVQAAGELKVRTDSSGQATIFYNTSSAAAHTITATVGGKSDSETINFDNVDDYTQVSDVDMSAPTAIEPGSTLTLEAELKDKYGNPVEITSDTTGDTFNFSWDGPGLIVGDTPTKTLSDGTAKIRVLIGQNDSGTGTATLVYDLDADATTVADRTVLQKTVTIGSVPDAPYTGEYGNVTAWTVNQNDGTAKVYVKFPPVGEKLRILHQTGGSGSYDSIYSLTTTSEDMDGLRQVAGVGTYVVRTIDLADGTNRIRVSLDGEDIEVNGKDRPARYNE